MRRAPVPAAAAVVAASSVDGPRTAGGGAVAQVRAQDIAAPVAGAWGWRTRLVQRLAMHLPGLLVIMLACLSLRERRRGRVGVVAVMAHGSGRGAHEAELVHRGRCGLSSVGLFRFSVWSGRITLPAPRAGQRAGNSGMDDDGASEDGVVRSSSGRARCPRRPTPAAGLVRFVVPPNKKSSPGPRSSALVFVADGAGTDAKEPHRLN